LTGDSLKKNLENVTRRLERALRRTQRSRITLVAVTKVFPAEVIRQAYALGLRDFGENYVQEFESKYPQVVDLKDARFHLIGHLQSNKARRAAEIFHIIQTVDSEKLSRRLNDASRSLEVMLEVKLSPEQAKSGVSPADLPALIETVRRLPQLRLLGLMTMPPWSDNPEDSRPYFQRLRSLAEQHGLAELSMGMSHDFEVAIEEGATMIRVGTALFGRRVKPEASVFEQP
jgi:hypothetical protein